jgi:hypothetical protein
MGEHIMHKKDQKKKPPLKTAKEKKQDKKQAKEKKGNIPLD